MAIKTGRWEPVILVLILLGVALLSFFAYPFVFPSPAAITPTCNEPNTTIAPTSPYAPVFIDPAMKLAELTDGSFTIKLFIEAAMLEPRINRSGTQVHMGYWSGKGNHGSLVRLIDDVNGYAPLENESPQKAIWDEGAQSSLQYPAYAEMTVEHWYERTSPKNGTVAIYGVNYIDPYNVTFRQADAIWGEYSERYADMAMLIRNATGRPVQVWAFVQGAKANRIFYIYEFPELKKLEADGAVVVHFAKTPDADWRNPNDWDVGIANATIPN